MLRAIESETNDLNRISLAVNANHKNKKNASMKLSPNTFQFSHTSYKCFNELYGNRSAQKCRTVAPSDPHSNFNTILTMAHSRINNCVASFVLRF